jgi:hypothetical protein
LTIGSGINYAFAANASNRLVLAGAGILAFPGSASGYAIGDFQPNFQFELLPEPASLALLIGGAAMMIRRRPGGRA